MWRLQRDRHRDNESNYKWNLFFTQMNREVLLKYANWNNNSSFYNFQCQNIEKSFFKYYKKFKPIYDKLNILPDMYRNIRR